MTSTSISRPVSHVAQLALAALLCLAGAAQAALTVYTAPAAFASATSAPGVDSFAGLSISSTTLGPVTRTAGAYSYSAGSPGDLFGGGTVGDPFLTPNIAEDSVTFSNFSSTVRGFAGNFFGSNINGAYAAGPVTLVVTDALGAVSTQTVNASSITAGSFIGFVSNAALVSVVMTAVQPLTTPPYLWPSVDNLTLAAAPVPEPGTYALLLAGLAGVLAVAKRRRV